MSHVTCMNESWLTYEWVLAYALCVYVFVRLCMRARWTNTCINHFSWDLQWYKHTYKFVFLRFAIRQVRLSLTLSVYVLVCVCIRVSFMLLRLRTLSPIHTTPIHTPTHPLALHTHHENWSLVGDIEDCHILAPIVIPFFCCWAAMIIHFTLDG